MAKCKINGVDCEWEGKKTYLQVALENGVELPHYCYHPGMSIVASCRICLADIAEPNPRANNELQFKPKLEPTCKAMAVDGGEVHAQTPRAIANQKQVMEYLLINHPLDCPVCDQAGECYLQDYSFKYGRGHSRFEELKIKQPKKNLGPNVLLYADRCIMCTRCVRFTREVTGTGEISVFGRGSSEQIDVFPGHPLDNELSGNVVDICPVGALLDKDFLMSMRVWNLEKVPSIDGLTASGDNISIEFNEDKIYRIKPRVNMDINQWWISDEIRYGWKFVQSPDRLITPTHKVHGVHEPLGWDAAYDQLTTKLKAGKTAAVISPMLPCEEAYLLARMVLDADPDATLAVGPVPVHGEDKTFPGGYTIRAEKCPNSRGVRQSLELLSDNVLDYDSFIRKLAGGSIQTVLLTGGYPTAWATDDLLNALAGKFTCVIDVLPSKVTEAADLVLPGATWTEKNGSFANADGVLQGFLQAIPVREGAKAEGRIALDLAARISDSDRERLDVEFVRQMMGGMFTAQLHRAQTPRQRTSDMQYVAL